MSGAESIVFALFRMGRTPKETTDFYAFDPKSSCVVDFDFESEAKDQAEARMMTWAAIQARDKAIYEAIQDVDDEEELDAFTIPLIRDQFEGNGVDAKPLVQVDGVFFRSTFAVSRNCVYRIGGVFFENGHRYENNPEEFAHSVSCIRFDKYTTSWIHEQSSIKMIYSRIQANALVLCDKIYVIGGSSNFNSCESYHQMRFNYKDRKLEKLRPLQPEERLGRWGDVQICTIMEVFDPTKNDQNSQSISIPEGYPLEPNYILSAAVDDDGGGYLLFGSFVYDCFIAYKPSSDSWYRQESLQFNQFMLRCCEGTGVVSQRHVLWIRKIMDNPVVLVSLSLDTGKYFEVNLDAAKVVLEDYYYFDDKPDHCPKLVGLGKNHLALVWKAHYSDGKTGNYYCSTFGIEFDKGSNEGPFVTFMGRKKFIGPANYFFHLDHIAAAFTLDLALPCLRDSRKRQISDVYPECNLQEHKKE